MHLTSSEREEIEVAALLHDVGIIGVPDQVLHKPTPLENMVLIVWREKLLLLPKRKLLSNRLPKLEMLLTMLWFPLMFRLIPL